MWLNGVLMCYVKYEIMWKCDQHIVLLRKIYIMSKLLLMYIDLWVSFKWDDHDPTNIMESHR